MKRRDFLKNSSLIALGSSIPEFLARTACAAAAGKDNILVVLEMSGGNDGLNTVVPFADERYYRLRPTIGVKKSEVRKVNDEIGLHPQLAALSNLLQDQSLAIVQGVGYPNPDRSHFESMDVWQSADPKRLNRTGWLARAAGLLPSKESGVVGMQVGPGAFPLALTGASGGMISVAEPDSFELKLTGAADRQKSRKKLIEELNKPESVSKDDLSAFVQRRQVQTLAAAEKIRDALNSVVTTNETVPAPVSAFRVNGNSPLTLKLQLVARLIQKGLGTRLFYVAIDGFDTHSGQAEAHGNLLGEVGNAAATFFQTLADERKRVLLMTYSEFGRRVKENGSRGTDHGAASCLFVAGPGVKAGAVGKHPSLGDLDDGDLKYAIDFRRVYATLLDRWLGCDSRRVLGEKFEPIDLVASH